MMKTLSTTQLIGYLGSDPVTRKTANGATLSRLRLATNYFRTDNSGNTIRKVTWHDVLAWNQLAEKVTGNFIKGSHVLVKGEIQYRTYLDRNGHRRYITEIRASVILNLDR